MSVTDDVIRRAFLNLEHFLQKVAALDIFEVLIFNYKVKLGLLDPLTVNFLTNISELCDELNSLLKESNVNINVESLPVSDTDNLTCVESPTKGEEIRKDFPIVLSFCGEQIDDKSLELVEIPVVNDNESQVCNVSDTLKVETTDANIKDGDISTEANVVESKSLVEDKPEFKSEGSDGSDVNKTHIGIPEPNRNNACKFCSRKFPSSSKLIGHLEKCPKAKAQTNNQESIHKCSQCDMTFSSMRILNSHMSENHDKGDATEDSMLYRVVEVQTLPENLPFYCCKTCLFVYKTPMDFEAHSCKEVSDNTDTEGYVGDYFYMLGKYLISNPDLLARMRKFRCGTCCEEYRSLSRMLYHLMRCTQGPYSCELCNLECTSKRVLNHHKKKAHRDSNSFFCDECGLAFKLRASLQKHKVNRHEQLVETTCEQCNLTFSKRVQLTNHMIREHQVERKFLCQVCGNKFSTHSSLMAHLSSHTESFKFSCSYCNKKFRQKEKLKFHIRIHTGERPHLCPTCGKGFIRKSKLDEHMRRHRGEKQHHCPMCSKCYASSWDLKLHVRKQHAEENSSEHIQSATANVSEALVSETEADDPGELNNVSTAMNIMPNEETTMELQELPEEATLVQLRELPVASTESVVLDTIAPNDGKLLLQLDQSQVANTLIQSANDSVGTRLLLQLGQNGDASSRILVQLDGSQVTAGTQATLLPSTILTVADTLQLTPVVDELNLNLGTVPTQYLQLAPGATGGTNSATTSNATTPALPVHIQLPVSAVPVPATAISQPPSSGTNPYGLQPVPVQAVFTPAGFNVNGITY